MKIHTLLGWIAVAAMASADPDTEFRSSPLTRRDTLPLRKWASNEDDAKAWKAPFAEPLRSLLELGLPDPAGLAYHKIEIPTGNCYDGDNGITQTEGWILPKDERVEDRHAITWNGLIYPLIGDLGPADLAARAAAIENGKAATTEWYSAGEENDVAPEATNLIRAFYLYRLGFDVAASKMLPAEGVDSTRLIGTLASDWLWFLYDRAVCAHMRGDPKLAFASLEEMKRVYPKLEVWANAAKKEPGNSKGWTAEQEAFRLECKRRIEKKIAGHRDEKTFVAGQPDIAGLIDALDRIALPQNGQPGDVPLWESPVVIELVRRGDDAVEPLLRCLESDRRMTQSVHFWRSHHRSRTILGVHEAALYALQSLLQAGFFELGSTGDSLTSRTDGYRKELAAGIRANWEKYGKTTGPRRSYRVLMDDAAGIDAWLDAASSLLHREEYDEETGEPIPPKGPLPGEVLRELRDPAVSDLLTKRLAAIGKQADDGDEDAGHARLALLAILLEWDQPRGRASISGQAGKWLTNGVWSSEDVSTLARFILEVSAKAPEILPVFEEMAWSLPPGKYDGWTYKSGFVTQMILQHGDSLKRPAIELWTHPDSPWCLTQLELPDLANVISYWADQELLQKAPFRDLADKLLSDDAAVGEAMIEPEDRGRWSYRWSNESSGSWPIPDNPKFSVTPDKPLPIRRKDVAGKEIAESDFPGVGNGAMAPELEYYWPIQDRNEWLAKLRAGLSKAAPARNGE